MAELWFFLKLISNRCHKILKGIISDHGKVSATDNAEFQHNNYTQIFLLASFNRTRAWREQNKLRSKMIESVQSFNAAMQQKDGSALFLAPNLQQKNSEEGYNSAIARLQLNIISKLFLLLSIILVKTRSNCSS